MTEIQYSIDQEKSYLVCETSRRTHYFQTPNLIDDLDLDPYAFRLYSHLKRVAGDHGKCFQSVTTMALHCKMSRPTLIQAKKELLKPRKELNGKSLILLQKQKNGADIIHIVDVWEENKIIFSQSTTFTTPSQPRLLKEEPIKNNDDVWTSSSLEQNNPETPKAKELIAKLTTELNIPSSKLEKWIRKYGKDYLIECVKAIEKKVKKKNDWEALLASQLERNYLNVDKKYTQC